MSLIFGLISYGTELPETPPTHTPPTPPPPPPKKKKKKKKKKHTILVTLCFKVIDYLCDVMLLPIYA